MLARFRFCRCYIQLCISQHYNLTGFPSPHMDQLEHQQSLPTLVTDRAQSKFTIPSIPPPQPSSSSVFQFFIFSLGLPRLSSAHLVSLDPSFQAIKVVYLDGALSLDFRIRATQASQTCWAL
ncbi:uncharacterized protein A1O9_08046 [Exophiala aquamarina CBS 119918]|uniref:Uncharacterized protein n=1 Tax=Exophiala aquamarina CBS 119918 TaxID=1182545 RepID=A0A072PLQ1_9EURO|nr:uncharacterized protein A1O9_08046 [Exophiala aquamarina CBS 119918]KEF56465.1 hypothetical protein A1O9_08046 [Exophiala aquamarina CBS 119918]